MYTTSNLRPRYLQDLHPRRIHTIQSKTRSLTITRVLNRRRHINKNRYSYNYLRLIRHNSTTISQKLLGRQTRHIISRRFHTKQSTDYPRHLRDHHDTINTFNTTIGSRTRLQMTNLVSRTFRFVTRLQISSSSNINSVQILLRHLSKPTSSQLIISTRRLLKIIQVRTHTRTNNRCRNSSQYFKFSIVSLDRATRHVPHPTQI